MFSFTCALYSSLKKGPEKIAHNSNCRAREFLQKTNALVYGLNHMDVFGRSRFVAFEHFCGFINQNTKFLLPAF